MTALSRLKNAVARAVPRPVAERVFPWHRAAFRAAGLSQVSDAARRLFIGPVNSAGQGFAWARAAERLDGVRALNFMYRGSEDPFAYPADHAVRTAYFVENRRWQRAQRRAIARGFTHVLLESGREILGSGASAGEDAVWLTQRGLTVGLLWHGSDIRTPSLHAQTEPDSPFRDGAYPEQARLEEIAARNHALITRSGLPSFVSTPDLLGIVPGAQWLPVVVDAELFAAAAPERPLLRKRPVVVHAPSRAGLKGTALIAETVARLHDEGLIEYREVQHVPAASMPAVYGDADIVLDQFSLGIYGVAAAEAMAGGRVILSHVAGDVRERVRTHTGRELPILQTRASELEQRLREIVRDPAPAQALAATGPEFVRAVHSGAASARVLAGFLGIADGASQPLMADSNDAR